jgi:hypothetical protein
MLVLFTNYEVLAIKMYPPDPLTESSGTLLNAHPTLSIMAAHLGPNCITIYHET